MRFEGKSAAEALLGGGHYDGMLSNFGVTPPNFTYSNIVGGIGIVGAMSVTTSDWQTLSEYELTAEEIMALIMGAMNQP